MSVCVCSTLELCVPRCKKRESNITALSSRYQSEFTAKRRNFEKKEGNNFINQLIISNCGISIQHSNMSRQNAKWNTLNRIKFHSIAVSRLQSARTHILAYQKLFDFNSIVLARAAFSFSKLCKPIKIN